MANSDKNILITPNTGSTTLNPTIRFTGANNTPLTLRTLDTGTVSFEGTAGQLFSISDGLAGTIFSVNDISGIPSIEVLDTGLIKLGQYNGQTVIGGASAVSTAELTVYPSAAASLGLVVKGFVSQSADLQQWQDSAGTVVAKVQPSGNATFYDTTMRVAYVGQASYFTSALNVYTIGAAIRGIVVRGATSQTANLQEWQDSSGAITTYVGPYGSIGTANGNILLNSNGRASFTLTNSTSIGLVIKGAASHTGDLQQWLNNAGTVLASVSSSGDFTVPSLTVSGDLTVNGTTTNINSTNLVVEDKNIVLGDTATPTDITADGGGLTLKGTTDKTFNWVDSTDSWTSSEHINLASGKEYYINGTALKDVTETLKNKTLDNPVALGLTINGTNIIFEGDIADDNETTLVVDNPTEDRTITFPDASGTVQLRVADVTDTEIGYLNGVTSNIQTQIDNVATIQGTQGIQGIQGIQGTQGITGTQGVQGVFNVSDTQPTPPYPGQVWVNATDGRTYVYDDTEWFEAYGNFQGIQGPAGAQGVQGPSIEASYDTEQSVISGQVFS